jgi:sugar-specific transcriptional regulator TrmB|tara:strand:- start:327 stop:482 length:156 start_codon:yes stop_codon:yes gene_type:complete
MTKKQKKLRREHFKLIRKLENLLHHPNFIRKNIEDAIKDAEKEHLKQFNRL